MGAQALNLMSTDGNAQTNLKAVPGGFVYRFGAMGSPCEVRIETAELNEAYAMGLAAETEANRIEAKFSRYRPDSVLSRINASAGGQTVVDTETAALLDFAAQCFELSEGLFDITSGVLRRVWRFDGSDRGPTPEAVSQVLQHVGWNRVDWQRPYFTMPVGMELDLGGLGKEYAVDCAIDCLSHISAAPCLVNFGGDLRVSGPRRDGSGWGIDIEAVDHEGSEGRIALQSGAVTTSGDNRRFLMKNGRRLGHILDPRTGEPVENPPQSVTVAAPTCIQAGFLSTLAMLHGAQAEEFLNTEGLTAWWRR